MNYSGDTNYSPSTSGPFPVDEVYPTQTTLTPSATTILDGQPLTLTARILPSQTASSPPTGSVTFSVYQSPVGTVSVSNNQAQFTIPSLGVGTIPINATYSGDSNYATSSATILETVNAVSTSTSLTSSSPTIAQGLQVTFAAKITPAQMGAAPPSGTVYFTANGIEFGNKVVSNNQAQATTSFATPGPVQIQVSYSGDANYTASTGTLTETVTLPPDFSLTAAGTTTQTVNAGRTATFTNAINVSALNGFSAPVNLSCSLPVWATATTCALNPSSFATGSGTTSVMVTTTSRGLASPLSPISRFYLQPQRLPLSLLTLLIAVALLRIACHPRQRLAGALPLVALVLFFLSEAIGCGGGSSGPPPATGTPAGTYAVTAMGTSGTTTHTTTLTLIVN
jgi:hypothetical protein